MRASNPVPPSPLPPHSLAWWKRVAATRLPVLIHGETGSGKERAARFLHDHSPFASGPWVALNCAALHPSLVEAELFGARRGAYTGADRDRQGLLRAAHGGTLLLDEVGEMSLELQAKVLRTLEERRARALGDDLDYPVRCRVLSATHVDLTQACRAGHFREDLYYRLAPLTIDVHPLRLRLQELPTLIAALRPRIEQEIGIPVPPIAPCAMARFNKYLWPGNIRELHAILVQATLRGAQEPSLMEPITEVSLHGTSVMQVHGGTADLQERHLIAQTIRSQQGVLARAAIELGWSRPKLYRRMRRHGLSRDAAMDWKIA